MAIEPVTREERFLAAAGGRSVTPPAPITRKEQLLQGIIDAVKSGGATPDVIEGAVNDYLNANPVQPGATTEQADQIEQNKNDIADLQSEIEDKQPKGDYVKTVNGNKPDASGNVVVSTGGNGSGQNPGQDGDDGATFTPAVSADGTLSWTNDKGLENPAPVNIKGPKGERGLTGETGPAGADGYTPRRGVDYWNPADKAEIVAMVIESLGGNPIFGTVDENNNIIVSGDLPDGTYSVKYEMANGTTVNIGNLVLDTNVYYTITNTLTNCTNSNSATKAVQGGSYSATISAKSGYELSSVKVTMGGTNISASAVSGGKITIANVTGNIVITAVATEIVANYTNLADPASADWLENTRISSSGFPTQSGITTSNWIAVTTGDVVRIKGIDVNTHQYARVAFFGSTKNLLSSAKVSGLASADATGITYDTTGAQFTIASANAKYIRICGELKGAASDVIITKNEPIE